MSSPRFTPTEQKIIDALSDGQSHKVDELVACLWDGDSAALRVHMTAIRKKLRPVGEYIVCESHRGSTYRHVKLLKVPSPYDGKY